MGGAWASGVNLYGTVVILGFMNNFGLLDLPPELQILGSWWVLALAVFLYLIEFVADKIPIVDSVWDAIHTFIRIPAGALLAAGALGGLDVGLGDGVQTAIALLVGGPLQLEVILPRQVVGLRSTRHLNRLATASPRLPKMWPFLVRFTLSHSTLSFSLCCSLFLCCCSSGLCQRSGVLSGKYLAMPAIRP